MSLTLHARSFVLPLDQPLVMGIVNVTPDSFSDGGDHATPQSAVAQAKALVAQGADILDLGAESTRPGAAAISAADELARLAPVLDEICKLNVPVSVDTRHTAVMARVLQWPIAMINDVNALQDEGAAEVCAGAGVAVCLMHMQGSPATMQHNPQYDDVVHDVQRFLLERAASCERVGIAHQNIVLDPGFGFGKTREHSVALMQALPQLCGAGYPVLVGWSRKSVLGALTEKPHPKDRLGSSIAAAILAAQKGVKILRVHNVNETVDALKIVRAFA